MSPSSDRPPQRTSQRPAAGPLSLRLQRLLSRLSLPFAQAFSSRRMHHGLRRVAGQQKWRSRRPFVTAAAALSYVGAVILVLWVGQSLYVVLWNNPNALPFNTEKACNNTEFSCSTLAGTIVPVLSLAVASAVFLLVRLSRVRRPYVRKARERPQELVQTAGNMVGEVVGRDQLCDVIIDDVIDPRSRRPHVIVGGVGTGKTALLVQLTKRLAEQGAVPVPVRLRDAQDRLDFRELAQKRFLAESENLLLSNAEGEKAWRHLYSNQQIVVLADGLEEALNEGAAEKDRDNLIRLAIRQANNDRLPLIVASRPHNPLRAMEAAIIELEPLSEEAALEYVRSKGLGQDERRLDWVVETADVAETPLYLQIARQLHDAGLIEYVSSTRDSGWFDTRNVDRAELRLRLLDTWIAGLISGHFTPGLPLSAKDRRSSVLKLSGLACIGLKNDSLHVKYEEFNDLEGEPTVAGAEEARGTQRSPILQRLERDLDDASDIRLAATWGAQLGLVEARGDSVRFQHSIMQAYLGSILIDSALLDEDYLADALKNPGRELLIALVMHSRRKVREARGHGSSEVEVDVRSGETNLRLQDRLSKSADGRLDEKALDLYAAALEIDSVDTTPQHDKIATALQGRWSRISAPDRRTLDEAKINLVRRYGEAARTVAAPRREAPAHGTKPAYLQLYDIVTAEESYPVRLAAIQEIGGGGDEAFAALRDLLGPDKSLRSPRVSDNRSGIDSPREAATAARAVVEPDGAEHSFRELVGRAWLAPLVAASVTPKHRPAARENLQHWLDFARARDPEARELHLSLEVALAQGFKHAANRRTGPSHDQMEGRAYLSEQARELLKATGFWFSRLTLVQALTLWSLRDPLDGRRTDPKRSLDPNALVRHWTALSDAQPDHPLVIEACRLAVWALETGQPERYLWIDESGIVARIGSQPANPGRLRRHNLWIPPSTGWTALDPRAQQLVADVLVLLNLAERGAPEERERRLRRTYRTDLPPCLAGDRSPLDPRRSVGMIGSSLPGSNCKQGCPFELCPYPPRGETSYRTELNEAFCRRQQALLRGGLRRKAAPWQGSLASELRQFWKEMAERAPAGPEGEDARGRRVGARGGRPR